MIKLLYDIALLSLLRRPVDTHSVVLGEFITWCNDNFLELDVSSEINFSQISPLCLVTVIHDKGVAIVTTFRYLGIIFDKRLSWDTYNQAVVEKSQLCLF